MSHINTLNSAINRTAVFSYSEMDKVYGYEVLIHGG